MPKKRFTSQYSKPASTVHPSLNSNASASASASQNKNVPSVNDLINSARKIGISPTEHLRAASSLSPSSHTLPPQIRHLLSHPETPSPTPRRPIHSRRFDANGRRIPAGPAPPRSWLEGSRHAPADVRRRFRLQQNGEEGRLFQRSVDCFPGLSDDMNGNGRNGGRSLLEMCLRGLARDWEEMSVYESNNLAMLPVGLRMALLSYIAVYGPEEGIGFQALKKLLVSPIQEESTGESTGALEGRIDQETENWEEEVDGRSAGGNNDDFFRLDLGGSVGRSVSLKQLSNILAATPINKETIPRSLPAILPHLTHLSLSHPPRSISWPRLLAITPHLKTITHLSLAYWPAPSLTPNSSTTVFESPISGRRDIQYGASNMYSRTLDGDFSESALVLKKLASGVYGLEYLDLEGCIDWIPALEDVNGVDWGNQWRRLSTLILRSGMKEEGLDSEASGFEGWSEKEKLIYGKAISDGLHAEHHINRMRKSKGLQWMNMIVDPDSKGIRSRVPKESSESIATGALTRNWNDELATAIANSAWES
ncbi:d473db66-644a-4620-8785-9578d1b0ecd2 [Sclerotinia trifoliorum]|uniref:D473db66-644a-4620-8785-9578d1b0ecd2 n=1 Tax=Sclerotinia trifoliorum TaxID=28548 RepID=A0A8H2ZV33_9HELO|nr:d473db66-644a-4620-8785-9578d1b0ecd2 [Sclerotinia trifoliorum]